MPREMLESGDWITPRLNYVEYFEKPPLISWLVAGSFRELGATEGVARPSPTRSASSTPRRRDPSATSRFYVFSQVVVIDMLLTFLLTACVGAIWRLREESSSTIGWPLTVASTAALAVLATGLVGRVLPGLVLVAASLADGNRRPFAWLVRPGPITRFLAIAATVRLRCLRAGDVRPIQQRLLQFARPPAVSPASSSTSPSAPPSSSVSSPC